MSHAKSSRPIPFGFHQVALSLRFVQGYRFLDRCGQALLQLENKLDPNWIVGESLPTGGSMRNEPAGLLLQFNSNSVVLQQNEIFDQSLFRDQLGKAWTIVREVFEIERITTPAMQVQLQKGYEGYDLTTARDFFASLDLITVSPQTLTLTGGQQEAVDFTLLTTEDKVWNEQRVRIRLRFATSIIRQERRQAWDDRLLLARVQLLGKKQAGAISAILEARKKIPTTYPIAIQFELERSFEDELDSRTFDIITFMDETWSWAADIEAKLNSMKR